MALLFSLPVAMAAGPRPRASFRSLQHRPASHRPLRRQSENGHLSYRPRRHRTI